MMKKHYGGLFLIVVLLVVVCCLYGSGVSRVRKHTKTDQANTTSVTTSAELSADDGFETDIMIGDMVTIEDEAVPVTDTLSNQAVTEEASDVGSSILFLISSILLLIIVVVVVIVATVAASTTVIEKF